MCSCHCMLCNRDGRVFNINGVYGNEIRTIREELLSIFGDEATEYLKDSDVVCAVCETLLNWFVKMRELWYNRMIYHPSCRANPKMRLQPVCYGKIWEAFNSAIQKGEFNDLPRSPNLLSSSPLLVAKRENHYDPVSEEILNEKFRTGGIYRPQSSCSADKEVEETLIRGVKRRKRRRRNEKKRRKNNSSAVSAISKATTKTKSSKQSDFADWDVASRFSFFSTSSGRSSVYSAPSTRVVTRSCTRMIMEDIQRQIDMLPEDFLIPCDVDGIECDERFETLEQLQEHKHTEHRMFYLYECVECRTDYVCEKDYDKHVDAKHDECFNHCLLCGIPMYSKKELVAHHQQHALHSVKCLYCDKAFLYKHEYDEHRRRQHDRKEKKNRNQRAKRLILEQADYDYDCSMSE